MGLESSDLYRSQTIGSDALRKAIERNRARQNKRQSTMENIREGVAKPNEFNFTTEIRTPEKKISVPVAYKLPEKVVEKKIVSPRKKVLSPSRSKVPSKLFKYFFICIWTLVGIMVLRLLFAERGVIDYTTRKNALSLRQQELSEVQLSNKQLSEEIRLLKQDAKYQKRMVREQLGFISDDEFLLVFSSQNKSANQASSLP